MTDHNQDKPTLCDFSLAKAVLQISRISKAAKPSSLIDEFDLYPGRDRWSYLHSGHQPEAALFALSVTAPSTVPSTLSPYQILSSDSSSDWNRLTSCQQ
ncbi:MAG: hypothetical protein QNK24_01320 [Desulfuromusa sp.]|nr:hypothetical protein [Desulfuromusa sp.]